MKKDSLATLHCYDNKQLLSNLHLNISNILNIEEKQRIFRNLIKFLDIFCIVAITGTRNQLVICKPVPRKTALSIKLPA